MNATLTVLTKPSATVSIWRSDPFLFRRVRTWFLLLAICLMAQGNADIFRVASTASEKLRKVGQFYAPSTTLFLLTLLLYGICTVLIVTRFRPTLRTLLAQKAVLSFVVLAFLSAVWSQDPRLTLRRAPSLLLTFALAWLFAASYSPRDQMRLLLTTGVILGFSSIAFTVALPQYGLDTNGEWRGIFGQKNGLGHSILYLFSCLAFIPIWTRRRFWLMSVLAVPAVGLVILSRSKGALLMGMLLIAVRLVGPLLRRLRREQRPFFLFATVLGMCGIAVGRNIVLALLGRDSTLTGRTLEWSILIPFALKHFWLGYGFQAFWTGSGDSLSAMNTLGGAIHGADSGYLDTALQLGLLGLTLFLLMVLFAWRDFVQIFRGDSVPMAAYWYVSIVLMTLVGNFVEGLFSGAGGASSFMFVVACAGLTMMRSEDHFIERT